MHHVQYFLTVWSNLSHSNGYYNVLPYNITFIAVLAASEYNIEIITSMNNWQLISYDESSKSTTRAFCTPVLSLLDELYHDKKPSLSCLTKMQKMLN